MTNDSNLKNWLMLTPHTPLLGVSERAPDGVENVAVFRTSLARYTMIYSEGLAAQATCSRVTPFLKPPHTPSKNLRLHDLITCAPSSCCSVFPQHLAHAISDDLIHWEDRGPLQIHSSQRWLAGRYGAPFVWRQGSSSLQSNQDGSCFWMALMGEAEVSTHTSFIGLLQSEDGFKWHLLPERNTR